MVVANTKKDRGYLVHSSVMNEHIHGGNKRGINVTFQKSQALKHMKTNKACDC